MRSKALIVATASAGVGFLDSLFLFYKYITADTIHCFLFEGCNIVAGSPYSHVFGIPLPTFGVLFYGIAIIFMVLLWRHFGKILMGIALLWGIVGFLFSLYFIFLQGFIIQAFCIYCLISGAASVVFLCALIIENNKERNILS